jgi:glycosyltransferase involved in cell wall biosynthesis
MSGRIAIVFPFPLLPSHRGKDLFLIPEGLRRLGYDVELHCPEARPDIEWPLPVVTAGSGGLERSEQYASRDLRAAIAFTYLHFPRVLSALRGAGLDVVAKGDTTGESVARSHPRATLTHALYDQPTRRQRAVAVAHWLARVGPLAGREARELQRVLELAHATVVETRAAHAAVERTLARDGARRLAERLHVITNPVADPFTRATVPPVRERLVVAVGRWDLAAKDAPLLARALDQFLARHDDHRAVIVGDGGGDAFGPRVERAGRLTQEEIVPLLGRARIVVTSSRWESFSLSSHEGLAMGCTVVGPQLQPLRDVAAAGPYATLTHARTAAGLAEALSREAAAWEAGRRDPVASAAFWRARLDVDAVGRHFAALLDQVASRVEKRP